MYVITEPLARKEAMAWIRDVMLCVVQAMVDNPDKVEISITHGEQTSVVNLFVAKDDLGKVIGKQGRNALALRTILITLSAKQKVRAVLEIVDDARGLKPAR